MLPNKLVKCFFSDVPEGRVAQVVRHASSFYYPGVQTSKFGLCLLLSAQFLREPPSHLCNFDCMLLPRVKDAPFASAHDLRDTSKSMKSRRIQNPIAVAFEPGSLVAASVLVLPFGADSIGPNQRLSRDCLGSRAQGPIPIDSQPTAIRCTLNCQLALQIGMPGPYQSFAKIHSCSCTI